MAQTLSQLFMLATGSLPTEQQQLSGSGSNRRYFRLISPEQSLIGVIGTSKEENEAFIYMSEHFSNKGLNVPKVVAVSDDKMSYLQQDLGDTILFDFITDGRKTGVFCEKEKRMLRKTICELARFQVKGAEDFNFNRCYPQPEFNLRSIQWDLNYFKYCFLKATGVDFQEDKLENDFERLAYILLQPHPNTFMYRDFQSRNVMLVDDKPYFIDFQGGRRGPLQYDLASFLWQAKAHFNPELRTELINLYLDELQKYMTVDRDEFMQVLHHFVLFRTMQVLGAYGFRGYFEKKPHFLQSIPFAIENLRHLVEVNSDDYPYLVDVLQRMTEMKQFKDIGVKKPLVVRVYSFSYKKGIPADASGNGGGFVFDCRAINNPGKYEYNNKYTGLDEPIIRFLEDDGEIKPFLESAYSLVDASVKRYIDRGFQNLMVCFGCTGGQHRSVYAAQKMAEHINDKFGVEVQIVHREQNVAQTLQAKN